MKHLFMVGAVVLSVAGCATAVNNEEYNNLAAQAENEIVLAKKSGFLWLHTEKFMKESKEAKAAADKAMEEGDRAMATKEFDKAMKLAKKALHEAQAAQQQARDNANPVVSFQ